MKQRAILYMCLAAAAAAGVAVELGIGGHREAWDVGAYWSLGLPLMFAAGLVFGFLAREQPVAVGYAPFAGQLVAMVLKTGIGSMIVPGIMLLGVLGAGGVAAATVGRAVARRIA